METKCSCVRVKIGFTRPKLPLEQVNASHVTITTEPDESQLCPCSRISQQSKAMQNAAASVASAFHMICLLSNRCNTKGTKPRSVCAVGTRRKHSIICSNKPTSPGPSGTRLHRRYTHSAAVCSSASAGRGRRRASRDCRVSVSVPRVLLLLGPCFGDKHSDLQNIQNIRKNQPQRDVPRPSDATSTRRNAACCGGGWLLCHVAALRTRHRADPGFRSEVLQTPRHFNHPCVLQRI